MRIDKIRFRVEVDAPDFPQQFGPADRPADVEHEVFQQAELAGSQRQVAIATSHHPLEPIQLQRAAPENPLHPGYRPAGERADAGQQLDQGKRLDQIIIGSRIETGRNVFWSVPPGEDQDGSDIALRPEGPRHGEAVRFWDLNIQDDEVRRRHTTGLFQGRTAVQRNLDGVRVLVQTLLEKTCGSFVVLDNQNLHGASGLVIYPKGPSPLPYSMTISARMQGLEFGDSDMLDGSLSALARSLRGSIILGIAADVREVQKTGLPFCNLTVGDFDPRQFPIPGVLFHGMTEALRSGETNYPPSDGLVALREAVSEYTRREHGVDYPITSILITAGGRPAIYAAFRCILNASDAVLYAVPSWNNDYYAEMIGARKVVVHTTADRHFQPTLDDLAPRLRGATLLCLCTPGNPTGTTLPVGSIREILQGVVEENARRSAQHERPLFVLYDLMYGSLLRPGTEQAHPLALVPEAAPWLVVIDGISKAFAGTGLRVGWAMGAPAVIARMKDFLGHVGAWAPRPEQVATAAFLRNPGAIAEFRATMDQALDERLSAAHQGFLAMQRDGLPVECVRPDGAMYVSLGLALVGSRVNGQVIQHNEALRRILLTGAGLAAVPFQAFGVPEDSGWFRLSVGAVSLADIEAMLPRVRRLLESVKS